MEYRLILTSDTLPRTRIAHRPINQLDLICYDGCDHIKHHEIIDQTHFVNPGEIMGMDHAPTWGLYDTETNVFEWVEVE